MTSTLIGARCASCSCEIIFSTASALAEERINCPACAERQAAVTETSVALRARLLSNRLSRLHAVVSEAQREELRAAVEDLRDLAEALFERHRAGT